MSAFLNFIFQQKIPRGYLEVEILKPDLAFVHKSHGYFDDPPVILLPDETYVNI